MLLFLLLLRQLLSPAMGCSALMLPPRLLPPECAALIAAAPAGVSANMLARFPMLVEQRGGVSAACCFDWCVGSALRRGGRRLSLGTPTNPNARQ